MGKTSDETNQKIPIAAQREIRDRYGRTRGSQPSFTVQIIKNELIDEKSMRLQSNY